VIVDVVVPKEGLVSITPEVVLGTNVLVWVFGLLLSGDWIVCNVLPVLVPQVPGVDTGDNQGRNGDIEGEFAPKLSSFRSMMFDSFTIFEESGFGIGGVHSTEGGTAKVQGAVKRGAQQSSAGGG